MSKRNQLLAGFVLLLAVVGTYSNHFQNSFHFDDWHAITKNPSIRSLKNLPGFFTDARTLSMLPKNQMYRPLLTTSLALDYWLGGGLKPFYFHLSTFLWFLAQLGLMFLLFRQVLEQADGHMRNWLEPWVAVAWYGLHPVCAETVNYIVQRAEVLATVGVVAALLLWIRWPTGRKYGIYLLPMILGALAKPTALMFAPILAVYLFLFESPRKVREAAPAFVVAAGLYLLQSAMLPQTVVLGDISIYHYVITQPLVTWHYFLSFFFPLWLTADTDRHALESLWSTGGLGGLAFVAAMLTVAWWAARQRRRRPIAFGILWFLLSLAPTALVRLAEVENDHRMFLPFVGLALAVCRTGVLSWERLAARAFRGRQWQWAASACVLCLLAAYAAGTYRRNRVWYSEESLWLDVTQKSPHNGRGLMNYGLTQIQKGDVRRALDAFERATRFTPNYSFLEINLGIALGQLRRDSEAESHFLRALLLEPGDAIPYFYYAQWLHYRGRDTESIGMLRQALAVDPRHPDSRYLLMEIFAAQANWANLKQVAEETLRLFPDDAASLRYLSIERAFQKQISDTEDLAHRIQSPEGYLSLARICYRAGRYRDSVGAAQDALKLRPKYPQALLQMAESYKPLGQWDAAIQAIQQALLLQPEDVNLRRELSETQAQKIRVSVGRH